MLAGLLVCCKEEEDSCPVEVQGGWSLFTPYIFSSAHVEVRGSAQDVAQTPDLIQKSLTP